MRVRPIDHMLIVADDSSMTRGILRTLLQRPGREVLLAANDDEAVQYAQVAQAAMVLLNFREGRLDALATSRRIRQLPNYKRVPIVVLTKADSVMARRKSKPEGVTLLVIPSEGFTGDMLEKGLAPVIASGLEGIARNAASTLPVPLR